jgi:hypothetical protein
LVVIKAVVVVPGKKRPRHALTLTLVDVDVNTVHHRINSRLISAAVGLDGGVEDKRQKEREREREGGGGGKVRERERGRAGDDGM